MNDMSFPGIVGHHNGGRPPASIGIEDLVVEVDGHNAVDGVSFQIARGRTLCLIGESGCGKSLTCFALLGELPPNVRIASGSIRTAGLSVAMIYQDATTSLNPLLTVGDQISEPLRFRAGMSRSAARSEALRLLDQVGISDPRRRYSAYPHELSGGMNQRVAIARALACHPDILLADEPTTALDVTVQAQILDLLAEIQRDTGLGLVFVTHDLGVAAEIADEIAVMYAGRIIERGRVDAIFETPAHPYTAGLLACLPRLQGNRERLLAIPGTVPPLAQRGSGCTFSPRCSQATAICQTTRPKILTGAVGRAVACHHLASHS